MMENLPAELVYDVACHFDNASDIAHLSSVSKRMHESIAADHYRIYNAFVRRYFPATSTPALWKDAAQALASRTRALDRRAVQARYLKVPPHILRQSSNDRNRRADRPTLGFRPPIDSYETLRSNNWLDRKEVLAYGAGADLIVRVRNNEHHLSRGTEWEKSHRKTDKSAWILHSNPGLAGSWHDITGIHLLPQLDTSAAYEEVIFARRSGDVQRAVLSPSGEVTVKQCFDIGDKERVEKTDLSLEGGRVLAVTLEKGPTKLFNVDGTSETEKVQPFASIGPQAISVGGSPRNRVSKLLSASRIALWSHHDGKSIELCDVTESGVREARNFDGQRENKNVYDFTPLEANARTGCAVGDLFLSGWQDGVVRLHDARSPEPFVQTFEDTVDFNPVYCLQSLGLTHFLVGSGGEGLVKLFDLRTPSGPIQTHSSTSSSASSVSSQSTETTPMTRNGLSVFLSSPTMSRASRPYSARYRGPVYSFSQPSPTSSGVWVGVENGIARLDFVSTDDMSGSASGWFASNNDLAPKEWNHRGPYPDLTPVVNLSGYERVVGVKSNPGAVRDDRVTPVYMEQKNFYRTVSALKGNTPDVRGYDSRWPTHPGVDEAWINDIGVA